MAVFRGEKTHDYTVMANHHLRDISLSLKAKGLLSLMLSLPDDWSYTMQGLSAICKDGIDGINSAIHELEQRRYVTRRRIRNDKGQLTVTEYTIWEAPQNIDSPEQPHMQEMRETPILESPKREKPILEKPTLGNPKQASSFVPQRDGRSFCSPPTPPCRRFTHDYWKSICRTRCSPCAAMRGKPWSSSRVAATAYCSARAHCGRAWTSPERSCPR